MILDGWGNGRHDKADVISTVHPAYISAMTEKYPHAELRTDGENVGLPDGQMGNSEVGHLNIGAGRVVYQDLVKINRACRDNSILQNPEIVKAFEYARAQGAKRAFHGPRFGRRRALLVRPSSQTLRHRPGVRRFGAGPSCTASWTAATPTRAAARASSSSSSEHLEPRRAAGSPRSSAATTPWTATSAGSA